MKTISNSPEKIYRLDQIYVVAYDDVKMSDDAVEYIRSDIYESEESTNKIMSADELPDEGYYLWREEPTDKWEPVQVQIDVDGVLMKTIWEIHYVHAYGQFYGPLVGPD